jgi:hypothetical protein
VSPNRPALQGAVYQHPLLLTPGRHHPTSHPLTGGCCTPLCLRNVGGKRSLTGLSFLTPGRVYGLSQLTCSLGFSPATHLGCDWCPTMEQMTGSAPHTTSKYLKHHDGRVGVTLAPCLPSVHLYTSSGGRVLVNFATAAIHLGCDWCPTMEQMTGSAPHTTSMYLRHHDGRVGVTLAPCLPSVHPLHQLRPSLTRVTYNSNHFTLLEW